MEQKAQPSDTAGLNTLTYAVRGGKAQLPLGALGIFCVLAAAYGTRWMLSGGGVTAPGVVLVLLVPGGLAIFGADLCAQGTWTTFLAWRRNDGRTDEYAFVGMGTASEARWLGANPAELPILDTRD